MIISNNQIRNILNQYLKQGATVSPGKKTERGQNPGQDNYKISEDARTYSRAKQVIKDLPEVREAKLAEIQKQVKTGTYEVTNEQVAEKMIGRSLVDKLV